MFGISLTSILLRFLIGGFAVALASIIAGKAGGKMGGVIATMPAVFLAAIFALAIDHQGDTLVQMSIHLSSGAILGILSCIVTVGLTALYIHKHGFQKGAAFSVVCWFVLSCALFGIQHLI
ncbi:MULTISPECIES: DUF3147 family protein [Staphylococcus]|uniref:DUF3147 domain-containing protein n=1 Tax=Staphylococcus schleiferi TaxID=1295 RepID=A0A7Z7QM84_STASC|nr:MULTISPECIES: DUF3147 family protein [Staphylococcus]QGS46508.1 DUF3147 family protein [Mammaliicoccus fleurettii]EPD50069.1 hypothetical protein HMPREF1208_01607 [Staphylococcus sp. HGB0015]MBF1992095.1 DUF3147 family protein [Staphylococcus schleiferi]MBF2037545.1 DUF3147 family protein [Staphylococcus schleiferi]MBF2099511.1 DUF3147 family protein [Staphylococcus schleiferi]